MSVARWRWSESWSQHPSSIFMTCGITRRSQFSVTFHGVYNARIHVFNAYRTVTLQANNGRCSKVTLKVAQTEHQRFPFPRPRHTFTDMITNALPRITSNTVGRGQICRSEFDFDERWEAIKDGIQLRPPSPELYYGLLAVNSSSVSERGESRF